MKRLILVLIWGFTLLAATPSKAQYDKDYFNYIGRRYLSDSQYEEAIRTFNTLLRVDPNAYETYFLRGVAKYSLGDLLGAESDFSRAIDKNPVYTLAYRNRAITRMRIGNYDDALKDFREAIALRPDLPDSYYSRGRTYLLTKQYDKALEDFGEFIKRESLFADAYISRGEAYLNMKDTVRAYEEFDRAVKTNREYPLSYYYRGTLYSQQKRNDEALADFNKSIECDSTFYPSYFNRAIIYAGTNRPMAAIADFDRVLQIDSTNAQTYFNRAILRTNIGDYNRALEDYNRVAQYSPGNVLLYFNRADLYTKLGDIQAAIADYSRAIELYPDFANAYLYRARLRYMLRDMRGSRTDYDTAERKIRDYRNKVSDSTFSIYADTARKFNRLLSFDGNISDGSFNRNPTRDQGIRMKPLFRFTFMAPDTSAVPKITTYYAKRLDDFMKSVGNPLFRLTTSNSDIPTDSFLTGTQTDSLSLSGEGAASQEWRQLLFRAIVQSEIKQYTGAVNSYTEAIDKDPANPFFYLNRSTTRTEMIDFISSIDNSFQHITADKDPSSRLSAPAVSRTYSYDEAIADLNKAAKLMPEFAHTYYNRGNLQAISGRLPEAYEDYTRAIELYPEFAEAYFNRGLVQIYMKDTRKGCLDISKAGELGIREAYTVLKGYSFETE